MRLVIFASLIVALSSCAGNADKSTDGAAKTETIAIFTKNQTNPYFQTIRLGADSAAKQMNVSNIHYVPTRPDSIPDQMSQIEDAIVKKPDAVVFIPVDHKAMVAGIEKLNAANIPVVNTTDRAAGGETVTFVGCDDRTLALNTARYLFQKMNSKGNVVIIEGVGGSSNNDTRMGGFRDALAEFKDIKVLASQPANFQRLQALQVMENLLQSHPQIDGVLAANDAMALGAIEALDAANRKSLVIGINGTKEAIDAIKAGKLLASGDCDGFMHGCFGTMAAVRHLRNLPVPKEIDLPVTVFDNANFAGADVPYEQRVCPAWESIVKN
jgi:ribose transport system substrate-binding protein